jgi:hypothetical protein
MAIEVQLAEKQHSVERPYKFRLGDKLFIPETGQNRKWGYVKNKQKITVMVTETLYSL